MRNDSDSKKMLSAINMSRKIYMSYFIENSLLNSREKRLIRKIFSSFFKRAIDFPVK